MRTVGTKRVFVGVLTATAIILTGCGDSSDDAEGSGSTVASVLEEVEGLGVEERRARLIELAEDEGQEVTIYTSLASENLDALAEEFQAATGVAMLTYRAGAEDVRTRVLQENQADRLSADVLAIGDSRLIPIADEGILAPYTSPHQAGLIEDSVSEFWTKYRFNLYSLAWNTDLVSADEVPTSYEELADPKWAGRMTLEPSDYDWFFSVSNYLMDDAGYSEEEVDQYWQDVAANADFNSGHTSTRQLLVAGEYDLFASDFSYGVAAEKEAGAPVEWMPPVSPLYATPEALAAVADSDSPASAILLMDWILSDGMEVLDSQQIDVTREELLEIADLDIRFVDAEEWVKVEPSVMEEYDALSGGAS